MQIDQRAARIAGVDGGIRLDEIAPPLAHRGPGKARDDAGTDSLSHAEGVANRQHQITHRHGIGIGHGERGQILGPFKLQDSEVRFLIPKDDTGREFAPIGQHHADLRRLPDHMIIRHDDPARSYDHA